MSKLLWTVLMLAPSLILSGCAKSIFDNEARCPFVDKGGCQSMEMVNQMVTERRFTSDGAFVQHFATQETPARKRKGTQKLTELWLAPWVDESGKAHRARTVAVVLPSKRASLA